MAGVVRERIRDWLRRRFPPTPDFVRVYECIDVTELLPPGMPAYGLASREGLLFASRDREVPAPRKEVLILTSVFANYSPERIIKALEADVVPALEARPHQRVLVNDNLMVCDWGPSSTGSDKTE